MYKETMRKTFGTLLHVYVAQNSSISITTCTYMYMYVHYMYMYIYMYVGTEYCTVLGASSMALSVLCPLLCRMQTVRETLC